MSTAPLPKGRVISEEDARNYTKKNYHVAVITLISGLILGAWPILKGLSGSIMLPSLFTARVTAGPVASKHVAVQPRQSLVPEKVAAVPLHRTIHSSKTPYHSKPRATDEAYQRQLRYVTLLLDHKKAVPAKEGFQAVLARHSDSVAAWEGLSGACRLKYAQDKRSGVPRDDDNLKLYGNALVCLRDRYHHLGYSPSTLQIINNSIYQVQSLRRRKG